MTSFDASMMNPTSDKVLWEGSSQDATSLASRGKVTSASYRITEDAIHFSSGVVSTREEMLPLWAVRDVDLTQSMTQRARGVGDLKLKLDATAAHYGQQVLVLKSISDSKSVRDLILKQANEIRNFWNERRHAMELERNKASASHIYTPAPMPGADETTDDLMDQLERLAAMKASGLLSDGEFVSAKAKLLGT